MRRPLLLAALVAASLFALMAGSGLAAPVILLGNSSVASSQDSDAAGLAEAFDFNASASGSARSISVYVDSGSSAGGVAVGLYADSGGHPGSLLASGLDSAPTAGQWNHVTLDATPTLSSGTPYWLAVLGTAGQLNFRDVDLGGGGCSETSSQSNLTSLPSTWTSGSAWTTCSISAYVNATNRPVTTSAPANTAVPTISGQAVQGQSLSASNGAWSNSPTGYAYQWQECDSAGANCTDVSGATSASYTLASGDVGGTVRVVVTATNGGGSTSATSAATGIVASLPSPPSNTGLPVVSGTTTQGQVLSTSNGSWSGSPTSYAYQWQNCDAFGNNCADVSGATSGSYTLSSADVGDTIRVVITATNAGGSTSATSAQSAVGAAALSPPPSNTALPVVSGTPQQGQTLTVSNGSWTGNPTSYSVQWSDGTQGSSDTLAAADVGQMITATVTASNSGGSTSATSAAVGPITSSGVGGLPGGVTLQQIDGGSNYFGQWSNSLPTSSSFYPIGVWDQTLGYNSANGGSWDPPELAAYHAEGINGFVSLYNGYNQAMISAIKADGMWVFNNPLSQGYEGKTLAGYQWTDEPDGGNRCGNLPSAAVLGETIPCAPNGLGATPSSVIAEVTADLHKHDPTRPVYDNYTQDVADYQGLGLTQAQAAAYVNAADIPSYDMYIINDGYTSDHNLWEQYDHVQTMRSLAGYAKPVWAFIEAGEPFDASNWSGITATPAMSVAEAWDAIIGGARGIEWFDHDFGGSSGGYATSDDDLIDSNPVFASLQAAVKAFDQRVTSLAPVLNSPFASGYLTHNGQLNVMAKYDSGSGDFYVFAAPRSNSSQNVTFTVAGGYTGPVTVQGENRTVQATKGVFTDTFANQTAVHIYQIP